jgi:PAS domain S-box-containing protein
MKDKLTQSQRDAFKALEPVFDASNNGIVIIDNHGIVLVYNKAAMKMLDDSGDSPVGRHMSEVRPEAWPEFLEILYSGTPQPARRIEFPNTTIIANRSPILVDGQVVGVISVFQDISSYEAIISELQGYKELHTELEAIFESSQDGLYITDGDARTIRVNSAYERVTGLKRQELLGRTMQDLVREGVFDHSVTLDVLEKGNSVTIMQNVKSGKQVMVTGTPIFDEEGKVALVVTNVRDITELNQLRSQVEETRLLSSRYYQSLMEQQQFKQALKSIVFNSNTMSQVLRKALKVAAVDTVVLLHGESGVGKTMLARIIHQMSPRQNGPFVKINCGAIPESLMESELFGYTKGAFTGASPAGKAGLIEMGHAGTVFLDEVSELTLGMQVKLLQVIEEQTFTRVGGTSPTSVDVRIIAATNRDLKEQVEEGLFRQDLFYRLNVIPLAIPALRERREDIPALALHFLEKVAKARDLEKRLGPEVLEALESYDYPGNVRELLNIIERMVVMSEGQVIIPADLPGELKKPAAAPEQFLAGGMSLREAADRLEAQMIKSALARYDTLGEAARALGVHASTLWRKMVKHGLRDDLQ